MRKNNTIKNNPHPNHEAFKLRFICSLVIICLLFVGFIIYLQAMEKINLHPISLAAIIAIPLTAIFRVFRAMFTSK